MSFQKLPLIPRKKLKWTNPEAYQEYKYRERLSKLETPNFYPDSTKPVASFKHSGKAGDLIYALPTIFALAKGKPIHLFLGEDQQDTCAKNKMGEVMMSKFMINMLQPLMWHQAGITSCDIYNNEKVGHISTIASGFKCLQHCSTIGSN